MFIFAQISVEINPVHTISDNDIQLVRGSVYSRIDEVLILFSNDINFQ